MIITIVLLSKSAVVKGLIQVKHVRQHLLLRYSHSVFTLTDKAINNRSFRSLKIIMS